MPVSAASVSPSVACCFSCRARPLSTVVLWTRSTWLRSKGATEVTN